MNRRQLDLRRTDVFACAAMLLSGVLAQAAMWGADHRLDYPVAAGLLVVVAGIGGWHIVRRVELRAVARFVVLAVKVLACMGIFAFSVSTGALGSLGHSGHRPSTTTTTAAIGAILLLVQLVQSATVASRRDLALGAPVVCAMLTQAGFAARDGSPAAPFALSLVAMVVAVALIYRAELLDGANVTSGGGGLLEAAAYPLVRVVVVAAVVFVLAPDSFHLAARPAARHSTPASSGARQGDPNDPNDPGVHSRALVDPSTGRLDLRVRGALSGVPIFVTSATAPAYWQGAVYDHYDGAAWTMTGGSPSSDWTTVSTIGVRAQHAPADPEQPTAGQLSTRADEVQVVSSQAQNVVFAPGRAVAYAGAGKVSADVDGNPRLFDQPAGPPSARDYDVSSTRPVVTAASAAAPVAASAGDIADPRWTQLPAELPARVRLLGAQLVGAAATRGDAVAAVDNYLHSNESYDLAAPLPAPGTDAVDDFLFVSHRGFCEQFATAAVLLLRSAGVPARLVTGYAEGDTVTDPGHRVMRGSDAHAWIQVWYPGAGWVDADPTASAVSASSGSTTPRPGAAAPPSAPSSAPSTKAAPAADSSPDSSTASSSPAAGPRRSGAGGLSRVVRMVASVGGRLGLAAGIVLLAALARVFFTAGRRLARRRRRTSGTPPPSISGGPLLQAYLRLDDELARAGRERSAGETPRDLPERLVGLVDAASSEAVSRAIGLLERECFDVEPPNDSDTLSALAVFEALHGHLRAIVVDRREIGAYSNG